MMAMHDRTAPGLLEDVVARAEADGMRFALNDQNHLCYTVRGGKNGTDPKIIAEVNAVLEEIRDLFLAHAWAAQPTVEMKLLDLRKRYASDAVRHRYETVGEQVLANPSPFGEWDVEPYADSDAPA